MYDEIYIYALEDPCTGDVRYVGQTRDLKVRLRSHLWQARTGKAANKALGRWIRSLLDQDVSPRIAPITECRTQYEADLVEACQVRRYAQLYGEALLNIKYNPYRKEQHRSFHTA